MLNALDTLSLWPHSSGPGRPPDTRRAAFSHTLVAFAILSCFLAMPGSAQKPDAGPPPVIIQPSAPGKPSSILPPATRATLPSRSAKDVEFMQGMITHHAQAVEMTAWIAARTQNKDIELIGARISQSQADEIKFMTQWLETRGEPVAAPMKGMSDPHSHAGHGTGHEMMMPGMLTGQQMDALKNAKGANFDRLFLTGMIQHHEGALVMVKELFDTAGAGQDAELFNFATDVDSGQRAEIRSMQTLLDKKP